MTERAAADQFVREALAGLSVPAYPDMAPDGKLPPYVIYGTSESADTMTNGDVRVMAQFPYTVRAVFTGNVSAVDDVEAAIETALHGIRQRHVGAYFINSKRSGALSSLTPRLGQTYRYAGGRYLVTVRSEA